MRDLNRRYRTEALVMCKDVPLPCLWLALGSWKARACDVDAASFT